MRLDAQLFTVLLLVSGDLVDMQALDIVELAGAKGIFLCGFQFNGIEMNLVELGRFGIPVIGIFHHDNLPAQPPRFQLERAVADEILRLGPAAASADHPIMFLDRRDMHGKPSVVVEQRKEVRGGGIERYLQCSFIQRLGADL